MIRRACKFVLFAGALATGGLIAASRPEKVTGSGVPATEDRAIGAVDEVTLSGMGNLVVTPGESPSLAVTADDNLLPLIEARTSGRRLHLTTRSGYAVTAKTPVTYTLTVPRLEKVSLPGSGTVKVSRFGGDKLAVRLSGSANATFRELDYHDLSLHLSGSGTVTLDGVATKASVKVSGSGDVDASELRSLTGDVQVSGSGKVKVWATQSINARVSGSGDVRYRGEPKVEKKVSGSGKVKPMD